jgi:hypothetical protein
MTSVKRNDTMIRTIISITTLAAAITGLTIPEAHAGGCESGAKITADIWKEHDATLKALGCTVVTIASEGSVPPNVCLDAADKVAKVATQMIEFWNVAAGNSWAKIGPRRLDLGTKLNGTLVSTGGRMFITATPLDKDTLDLDLEKIDGKAKTEVTVCKEYRGKMTTVWTFMIDNGNDNVGKKWTKHLTGVKGHNIVFNLDAKSVANTFKYELTANEK